MQKEQLIGDRHSCEAGGGILPPVGSANLKGASLPSLHRSKPRPFRAGFQASHRPSRAGFQTGAGFVMNGSALTRERSSFRPSPDKGRAGGVCGGEIRVLCMMGSAKPPSIPPCQGGRSVTGAPGIGSSGCPDSRDGAERSDAAIQAASERSSPPRLRLAVAMPKGLVLLSDIWLPG